MCKMGRRRLPRIYMGAYPSTHIFTHNSPSHTSSSGIAQRHCHHTHTSCAVIPKFIPDKIVLIVFWGAKRRGVGMKVDGHMPYIKVEGYRNLLIIYGRLLSQVTMARYGLFAN